MTREQQSPNRELTTAIGILSWPILQAPERYQDKGEPRYSALLVFPGAESPGQAVAPVAEALKQACRDSKKLDHDDLRAIHHCALKSGVAKIDEQFGPGSVVLKASNARQPQHFDHFGQALDASNASIFQQMFYAGARARFFVWAHAGVDGGITRASLLLKGVQFAGDGDRIDGGSSAVSFDPVPGAEKMIRHAAPAVEQASNAPAPF